MSAWLFAVDDRSRRVAINSFALYADNRRHRSHNSVAPRFSPHTGPANRNNLADFVSKAGGHLAQGG